MTSSISRKQFLKGVSALGAGAALTAWPGPREVAANPPAGPSATGGIAARPPGLTAEAADFVVRTQWSDLPAELVELGKKHILDAFGLALAGERAESGPIVRRYLQDQGLAKGPATILGTRMKAMPRFAAFANGVAIHADDYDDTQLAVAPDRVYGLLTHPTVTALPAALAVAEAAGKSGRDFMLAYHLGVEVETKVAEAISPRSYEGGFHSTPMCGVFGSAVSAAKLRGLPVAGVRQVLGLAAAEAGGLRENFGTMTKPYQAGHGAEAGVTAADLVALGWTAADTILEAKRGFFAAFGGGFDAGAIAGQLGRPWTFLSPGVSIKPYPSGSLSHPAMDELRRLIEANRIKTADVAQVRVGTNKQMLNTLIHHQPKTGLQGKFSMEYCMAVLLIDGKAGLAQFTDQAVNRPAVQELISRVDFYNNPDADAAGADKMRSYVEIRLNNGQIISGQADFARGSPQMPMSFDDAVEKFRGCAEYAGFAEAKAKAVVEQMRRLETVDNMRAAVARLFA
jgi:2-methylcitrate dehydratase PrpD